MQYSVSELIRAKGWAISPRDITELFYKRILTDDTAPIVGGRRMIPDAAVWLIESKLRAMGKLPKDGGAR
jgi:hypothetical protein